MKKAIIIFSGLAVVGFAGYYFYNKQVNLLTEMKYKFVGVSVDQLALINTVANLKIQIESDSTLEAEILDLDLDVYINDKYIGKITENKKIVIPAKGYSVVEVKVTTNALQAGTGLLDSAAQIWKAKDALLTVKGVAKVKSAFITFNKVPVNYSESIKYLMS